MNEKQKRNLRNIRRRAEYQGCTFQVSAHGAGRYSVQVFRQVDGKSVLVADFDL